MDRPLAPGLLRIFRYVVVIMLIYFGALLIASFLMSGFDATLRKQLWVNFVIYLILYAYLQFPVFEKRLKGFFLPLGLFIAVVIPIFSSVGYLLRPSSTQLSMIIQTSWYWLPILLVVLVLIAWQYDMRWVIIYTVLVNGLELLVMLLVARRVDLITLPFFGVPMIRAFAFGVVGQAVDNLVAHQEYQRNKLIQANIQMGQYASTLEKLTTLRERNRLADELHDTLAHTLTALAVNLEAVKADLTDSPQAAAEMVDKSLTLTRTGLKDTRRALKDLRALPLEELGLVKALEALGENFSDRSGIPLTTKFSGDMTLLPESVEQCIYRISQESLENISRHSGAKTAGMELTGENGKICLQVKDDGMGFDPKSAQIDGHYGLTGMRERARSVGGELSVKSTKDAGTTVAFTWEHFIDQSTDL